LTGAPQIREEIFHEILDRLKRMAEEIAAETGLGKMSVYRILAKEREEMKLSEIIGQMPPARRKIYLLNKSYGMSIDDIARKLQISSKTVENQLYQANVFIRKKFKNLMRVFALLWIYMIYGQ